MTHCWRAVCTAFMALGLLATGCSSGPVSVAIPSPPPPVREVTTAEPAAPVLPSTVPISGAVTAQSTASLAVATPESVVQGFYDWYLSYARSAGNPLVDRSYRSSNYLLPGFVQQVDETLASFAQGGYNPFLCVQDVPDGVQVGPAQVSGDKASLVVQTGLQGHSLNVELVSVNSQWKISAIACQSDNRGQGSAQSISSPEKVVQSFYDWYLNYSRLKGNPMDDGAYKTTPFLTQTAVGRLEQTWAGFGDGPRYDPISCAKSLPERIDVEPAALAGDEARVFVRMLWSNSPSTSQTVALVQVGDEWKIDDLTCAVQIGPGATATARGKATPVATDEVTAGWQVFRDTQYGYEIKYPLGWVSFDPNLATPDPGSTLARVTGFAPPDAPKGLIPVSVELYRGTDAQFLKAFPGTGKFEEISIDGNKVLFDRGDPTSGRSFYVLKDPAHLELHVVVRCDDSAAPVVDGLDTVVKQMVSTLKFDK